MGERRRVCGVCTVCGAAATRAALCRRLASDCSVGRIPLARLEGVRAEPHDVGQWRVKCCRREAIHDDALVAVAIEVEDGEDKVRQRDGRVGGAVLKLEAQIGHRARTDPDLAHRAAASRVPIITAATCPARDAARGDDDQIERRVVIPTHSRVTDLRRSRTRAVAAEIIDGRRASLAAKREVEADAERAIRRGQRRRRGGRRRQRRRQGRRRRWRRGRRGRRWRW